MVAVAILGLSLTVILSAQAGLYASGTYAQHISVATGLARCRMSELEERLLKFGYPEIDDKDDGPCCQDDDRQDMRCEWKVEKIELPQAQQNDMFSKDGGGLGAVIDAAGSALGGGSSAGSTGAGTMGGMGPLGALAQLSGNPQSLNEGTDGGFSNLASSLSGSTTGSSGGGATAAIAPLVMSFVYPQLKPMLEASIRKVTVRVVWHEGLRSRDVEIVQYLTNPVRGNLLPGSADGGLGGFLGGGSTFPGGGLPGGATSPLPGAPGAAPAAPVLPGLR